MCACGRDRDRYREKEKGTVSQRRRKSWCEMNNFHRDYKPRNSCAACSYSYFHFSYFPTCLRNNSASTLYYVTNVSWIIVARIILLFLSSQRRSRNMRTWAQCWQIRSKFDTLVRHFVVNLLQKYYKGVTMMRIYKSSTLFLSNVSVTRRGSIKSSAIRRGAANDRKNFFSDLVSSPIIIQVHWMDVDSLSLRVILLNRSRSRYKMIAHPMTSKSDKDPKIILIELNFVTLHEESVKTTINQVFILLNLRQVLGVLPCRKFYFIAFNHLQLKSKRSYCDLRRKPPITKLRRIQDQQSVPSTPDDNNEQHRYSYFPRPITSSVYTLCYSADHSSSIFLDNILCEKKMYAIQTTWTLWECCEITRTFPRWEIVH